jgi:hypothetical protein
MDTMRCIQERQTGRTGHDLIDSILGQAAVDSERAARKRAIMQEAQD